MFGGFRVFSLAEIRQAEPAFDRRRLSEWQGKGYIRMVIKGYYTFSDFALGDESVFEIANRIYSPSYVSFESALSYYELIPESIYGITSASTLKTAHFKTPVGEFSYRSIHPKLYFGFELLKAEDKIYKLASMEKALLDFLYFRPSIREVFDFAGLRLNLKILQRLIDRKKMNVYAQAFLQKSLIKRMRVLWRYIEHA
ncbi:MAG: hypothetical protein V2A57_03400 [Elusimicrobiota bacterium]